MSKKKTVTGRAADWLDEVREAAEAEIERAAKEEQKRFAYGYAYGASRSQLGLLEEAVFPDDYIKALEPDGTPVNLNHLFT